MPVHDKESLDLPAAKKMKIDTKCVLRFAKLTEHAFEPIRGSVRAAGVDLRSAYDIIVPAHGKAIVKTDLQVQVPEGSYGRVAPRSGLAVKNFIDVGAGVVDEDYRGNLGVVLFNHADVDFEVKRGDRIAQFICERIFYPEMELVDKLDNTERGAAGFGSTGVKELPAAGANDDKKEAANGKDNKTEANKDEKMETNAKEESTKASDNKDKTETKEENEETAANGKKEAEATT